MPSPGEQRSDPSVYDGRSVLSGRNGSSFMWVDLVWAGQDKDQPYLLPDGREYRDLIADGEFRQIADQVWLSVTNAGNTQDMLWTTSTAFPVVSVRMADALVDICGEGAFERYPVTVRRKRPPDIDGYVVLIPTGLGVGRGVREFPLGHRATSSLDVDAGVLEQLRARSIEGFEVADARELAELFAHMASRNEEPRILSDPALWSVSHAPEVTQLRLTLDTSVNASMIELSRDVLPAVVDGADLTEEPDGSLTFTSNTPSASVTLSNPVATDATGVTVGAFWFVADGRVTLNVDHIPGSHAYPVTVDVSMG